MTDFSEVPIPPDSDNFEIESMDKIPQANSVDPDSDSLWQQQLVDTEQQILKEKESSKRHIKDDPSEDEPSAKKRAIEYEKLWKNVNDAPSDFQSWTLLLQHVDQSNELEPGRKAYDGFFLRYPYCYGYWKKYAELEKRKGTQESTLKVFHRGLEAISLSVDLWIHYMDYVISRFEDNEDYIREEFERAIETCGLEFRSDKLWDLYIGWESSKKHWKNVTSIYQRLLGTPISKYIQHWQKFQDHIKKYTPNEVINTEEYTKIRKSVLADLNQTDDENPDEAPPGVETADGEEQVHGDEEAKDIQKRFIESWQKIHEETVVEAKARWSYEDAIKRPYFHVKALEKSQLNAWRNYLDFELTQNNHTRIKILFERCLIACAFYEEFWMRYIHYLEDHDASNAELRTIYKRMCTIHLREKLRPHLSFAAFEEESGNPDQALEILRELQSSIPFCLESYVMAASIERRRGNLEAADELFSSCIETFKSREDRQAYSSLLIKYSRFLTLFKNESHKAVEVLQGGLEVDETNPNLLLALVDNCLACRPPNFNAAAEAIKTGTKNSFPPSIRMVFAHRYINYATECASEDKSIREALRIIREVRQEIRQMEAEDASSPSKMSESPSSTKKQSSNSVDKTVQQNTAGSYGGASAGTMNGATNQQPQQNPSSYSNYSQGYNYNQGYPQAYGGGQYQGWGYPSQPGSYGYNQQNWGGYPNYYGQR